MNSQTALQVTDFDFYGDNLIVIALKDNATGEIYTAINSVLKGIGLQIKTKFVKDVTNGLMIQLFLKEFLHLIFLQQRE